MADILIRGVAVPDRCDYRCPFYVSKGFPDCGLTGKSYNWGLDKRPSDCPIIELPEHGDLIDRSKLPFVCGGTTPMEMDYVRRYFVDRMPVIVPSNKEDEE